MEPYLYLLRRSYPFQDFVYNFLAPNLKLQPGQEIKSADSIVTPICSHKPSYAWEIKFEVF